MGQGPSAQNAASNCPPLSLKNTLPSVPSVEVGTAKDRKAPAQVLERMGDAWICLIQETEATLEGP